MAEASLPKKRNRNRLKEFYGIKKDENVDKTTDINSDQFHSDVYIKVRKPLTTMAMLSLFFSSRAMKFIF